VLGVDKFCFAALRLINKIFKLKQMQGNQGTQRRSNDLELGSCPFSDAMKPKGHESYTDKT